MFFLDNFDLDMDFSTKTKKKKKRKKDLDELLQGLSTSSGYPAEASSNLQIFSSLPEVFHLIAKELSVLAPPIVRQAERDHAALLRLLEKLTSAIFQYIAFLPHIRTHQDSHPVLQGLVRGTESIHQKLKKFNINEMRTAAKHDRGKEGRSSRQYHNRPKIDFKKKLHNVCTRLLQQVTQSWPPLEEMRVEGKLPSLFSVLTLLFSIPRPYFVSMSAAPSGNRAIAKQVEGSQTAWFGVDRDYTYDELLTRVFDIMRDKNPDMVAGKKQKFVMRPPQVVRIGTKKTSFANFTEICKTLHRQPKHLLDFLLAELGTSGSVDGNSQLIIKGRFQQKQIENVLRRYIKEYVTCHTCRSPDTILQKDTRLFFLQCETCGSRCSVASIKSGFQAVTGKLCAIMVRT
ncbi:hypothetical protein PR048_021717 [Dryococelus australis]|uniref:Eukaryotic translation initiation factor 2 subunit 2 n=1 Tax=Dryococelus australis TaxID=614101 RepID=A0ABQ9GZ12_9NEOP|nr:hypothetical protein PR048_021717 [Dryococelus australis]